MFFPTKDWISDTSLVRIVPLANYQVKTRQATSEIVSRNKLGIQTPKHEKIRD